MAEEVTSVDILVAFLARTSEGSLVLVVMSDFEPSNGSTQVSSTVLLVSFVVSLTLSPTIYVAVGMTPK